MTAARDRVAARLYGTILATTDDLPDDLAAGVEAALAALPVAEVVDWLVESGSLRPLPDLCVYGDQLRPVYVVEPGGG